MQPYNSPNPGMPTSYQQINSNPMTMIPQGAMMGQFNDFMKNPM